VTLILVAVEPSKTMLIALVDVAEAKALVGLFCRPGLRKHRRWRYC
jgi:hypothetical protein